MAILVVGTLDTKGKELEFVRDRLSAEGLETVLVDAGSMGPPLTRPDVDRDEVFRRAGTSAERVRERGDRGEAVAMAAEGVASLARELEAVGRIEGVLAIGGSAGTTIGSAAMRALPFGMPKVLVSTLASGNMRPYVGGSDILVMHSVADLAGLNRLTRTVLENAADAMAGMVRGRRRARSQAEDRNRMVVAATMFGVTTPCVDRARRALEEAGSEVIVFHATGVGGQAMEGLIRDGRIDAVLDLTTTEMADEVVGGILSAGPDRLRAAGRRGIPQVVSLGALDMVNFGPRSTVPERFSGRLFYPHNPNVTLMRTTAEECGEIGRRMGEALGESKGSVVVLVPRGGVSALDAPGKAFWDLEADGRLVAGIREGLAGREGVRIEEMEENINDETFAERAVEVLRGMMEGE